MLLTTPDTIRTLQWFTSGFGGHRMCLHLMKRHKVKDKGMGEGRFPSIDLYGRYGLTKIPTAAGWRSAHALA